MSRRVKGPLPMTPRVRAGLLELLDGGDLNFRRTGVGRPTKQRLAKHGLAEYTGEPRDWDGSMRLTDRGRRVAERLRARIIAWREGRLPDADGTPSELVRRRHAFQPE